MALLVVAPWGVGRLAEKRLDHGLDKLVEAAPYLTVVEAQVHARAGSSPSRWSTFEVFSTWMKALSPKAMEDAHEQQARLTRRPSADPRRDAAAPEPSPSRCARGCSRAAGRTGSAGDAPKLNETDALHRAQRNPARTGARPVRLRHRARGFALRVERRSPQGRSEEIFGPKAPLEDQHARRIPGRWHHHRSSPKAARSSPRIRKAEITWDTFKLAIGYSKNADKY